MAIRAHKHARAQHRAPLTSAERKTEVTREERHSTWFLFLSNAHKVLAENPEHRRRQSGAARRCAGRQRQVAVADRGEQRAFAVLLSCVKPRTNSVTFTRT